MTGLISKLLGRVKNTDRANTSRVVEDREVIVELVDGTYYEVPSSSVHIDRRNLTVWISKKYITAPPISVHIPVETKNATNNIEEKTEHDARLVRDVTRYSKVVNPSNDPDSNVDLDIPYYEIWF